MIGANRCVIIKNILHVHVCFVDVVGGVDLNAQLMLKVIRKFEISISNNFLTVNTNTLVSHYLFVVKG